MDLAADLNVDTEAAARLCIVETYAAGPGATKRIDQALVGFQELADYVFAQLPGRERMPAEITRAMVGALRKLIHSRLHRHTEAELVELVPQLMALGLSYHPPPRSLRAPRRRTSADASSIGGRSEDPADRIARAALACVAAKGYGETTITDIATAAGVSLRTFYEYFDGKEQAVDNGFYGGRLRMLAAMLPAFERAHSWPRAIRAAAEATLSFFESEPDFTRVATVEIYTAGSTGLEQLDLAIESIEPFLEDGFEQAPQAPPISREAIAYGLYSLLSERVQAHGAQNLRAIAPLITYVVLAPFLGAEEACRVANGED